MDKLERLLNLTAALLHAEMALTADEIRERVGGYPEKDESFRRSFERDKDDLRSMGMPIRVEPAPGRDAPVDGYRMTADDYAGDDLRFEPDELAALHLASNLVQLDGDSQSLARLGAAGEFDTAEMGQVPFNDTLASLITAAADHQAVAFRYGGADRVVEPWRVSFSRGHWYLNGWDRLREGERLYRVDRLEGATAPAGAASQPVGTIADTLDLRGWELGDADPVMATVRIDSDQAEYARHILGAVDEASDGSVTAMLQVRNREAFRSFVLSFLEHAEILEPAELREDLVDWLNTMSGDPSQ